MNQPIASTGANEARAQFEIRAFRELGELSDLWLDLERRSAAPFFLSWDWIGCWIEEASIQPYVLIGRAAGQVILLGIVTRSVRRDFLPIPIHGLQLHMTGDARKDVITIEYNSFLVDQAFAGSVEAQAIAFLLSGREVDGHRCDELHLKNVPVVLQQAVQASGYFFREVQRKPSWRVDLVPIRASGKDYLSSLSANTRQQIRRSMRLYEQQGSLRAERAQTSVQALEFLDGLKELHQKYWVGRGEPGAFSYPFFEAFQKRLIQTCLPHGTVELVKVTAGSELIGYVYNLVYRGHAYAYQTGIHYPEDARLKPGLVSHTLCINQHLADGSTVYDFMAGDARYKASLGERGPDMVYLLAERSTWPQRLENQLHSIKHRLNSLRSRHSAEPAAH